MKYLLETHDYLKNLSTFKFIIAMLILIRISMLFFSPITYILLSFAKNPEHLHSIYLILLIYKILGIFIILSGYIMMCFSINHKGKPHTQLLGVTKEYEIINKVKFS